MCTLRRGAFKQHLTCANQVTHLNVHWPCHYFLSHSEIIVLCHDWDINNYWNKICKKKINYSSNNHCSREATGLLELTRVI